MAANKYAGTQTEKNLQEAFAGESQARNLLEIIIAIFRMIFIGLFYIAKFMFVFFILLFFWSINQSK